MNYKSDETPYKYKNHQFHTADWSVTGRCNYNCRHCFTAKNASAFSSSEFTFDECVTILDEFVRCGIRNLSITGGEPFVRSDLPMIFEEVTKRKLSIVSILTNGSLVNDKILDKLLALGQQPKFKVSFDGVGYHDTMRGVKGAEEAAIKTIKLLKSKGFRVCTQTCIHKGNINLLYETAVLLANLKVDKMNIIRTSESTRWLENGLGELLSPNEYYDSCLEFLQKYIQINYTMVLGFWHFLTYYPQNQRFTFWPVRCMEFEYQDNMPACRTICETLFVGSDGSLAPCNPFSGFLLEQQKDIGNIKHEKLQKLLFDSKYSEYSNLTAKDVLSNNAKCSSCEYSKLCLGGCRAIGFKYTGDMKGQDPLACAFFYGNYLKKVIALVDCNVKESFKYLNRAEGMFK